MSKQKALSANSFVGEIFHVGLYKPTQGRITRQVTCASVWVVVLLDTALNIEKFSIPHVSGIQIVSTLVLDRILEHSIT